MKSNRSSAIPPHRAHHRLTRAAVAPLLAALLIAAPPSAWTQDAINVGTDGTVTMGKTLTVNQDPGNAIVLGPVQKYGQGTHVEWNRDGGSGSTYFLNQIGLGNVGGFRFGEVDKNGKFNERMRLDQAGNLGIGTPTPTNKLSVAGNADFSGNATIGGNASISGAIRADGASFLFTNGSTDETSAVVLRRDANWAYLFPWGTGTAQNTVSIGGGGVATSLHVSGNTFVDGTVGIGVDPTTSTNAKLQIKGSINNNVPDFDTYAVHNGEWQPGPPSAGNNPAISIWASQCVATPRLIVFSDERIKRREGRSDAGRDLSTLMDIEVTDFSYIDTVAKGAGKQKKLIAQQVEQVFPQAVSQHTDVVPDIFQQAEIEGDWIKLATSLRKGDRVRLIGPKSQGIHEVLEVAEGRFRTDFAAEAGSVFVYGREVKDFRALDYDAIAMLNVSATQQIKKEKDAEVSALQQENKAFRARLEILQARDKLRDERLTRLEQDRGGARPRPPSPAP